MDNKQKLTAHNAVIESNNNILRSLPTYENLTDLVNYQPPVLEQIIEVLTGAAGIGGGSGKYVWEKYGKYGVIFTMTSISQPVTFRITSDTVDVTKLNNESFYGTTVSFNVSGYSYYNVTHKADGTALIEYSGGTQTIKSWTYDPSTQEMKWETGWSSLMNTNGNVKVFEGYVVAYDENAYPNGGTQDGYWYELYTPDGGIDLSLAGITHVAIDKFTLSSNAYNTNLSHSLSVIPTFAILTTSSAVSNGNNSSMLFLNKGTFVKRFSTNTGYWCATGKINNGTECLFGYDSLDDVFANVDSSVIQYYGTTDSGKYSAYLQAGVEYTLITMA